MSRLRGMGEPTSIRCGDSVTWHTEPAGYTPAAGWSLRYRLLQPAGALVEVNGVASGAGWDITLPATETAKLIAGTGTLVPIVEKPGLRATLALSSVTILPDLSTLTAFDARSDDERALAQAEAALAEYAATQGVVEEFEVAGRRMKFRAIKEIEDLIAFYARRVRRVRIAKAILAGEPPPGRAFYRG